MSRPTVDELAEQLREVRARTDAQELDGLLEVGDLLTLTWGKETFTPVRFHSFEVGPFAVQVSLRQGETARACWHRGMALLDQMAVAEFAKKVEQFLDRVKATRAQREVSRVKSEV